MNAEPNELSILPVTFVDTRRNQATFQFSAASIWRVVLPDSIEPPLMAEFSWHMHRLVRETQQPGNSPQTFDEVSWKVIRGGGRIFRPEVWSRSLRPGVKLPISKKEKKGKFPKSAKNVCSSFTRRSDRRQPVRCRRRRGSEH